MAIVSWQGSNSIVPRRGTTMKTYTPKWRSEGFRREITSTARAETYQLPTAEYVIHTNSDLQSGSCARLSPRLRKR